MPNRQAGILIVSAPRQLMPMVSAMIQQLDANAAGGIIRGIASPGFGDEPDRGPTGAESCVPAGDSTFHAHSGGALRQEVQSQVPRAPATINTDLSNTNIERVITPH